MRESNDRVATVVIATFNSANRLETLKQCIDEQRNFDPSLEIRVVIFDGGSTDGTKSIAESFGFEVVKNVRGDAISAKFLALTTLSTKYLVFLDHDEYLINPGSISRRIEKMNEDSGIKAILSEGYSVKKDDHTSNTYASEYGDPLSAFVYRTSSLQKHRLAKFKKRLEVVYEDLDIAVMDAKVGSPPLLCELVACGTVIDRKYFIDAFPEIANSKDLVPHLYYFMAAENTGKKIGISKLDPVVHSTSTSWKQILHKIRWRISNRFAFDDPISNAGHKGRAKLINSSHLGTNFMGNPSLRTIMFVPYTLLVLPVLIDSALMAISRKRVGYMMHFPLSFFVVFLSFAYKAKQLMRLRRSLLRYDGSNT